MSARAPAHSTAGGVGAAAALARLADLFGRILRALGRLWQLAAAVLGAMFGRGRGRKRKLRPWMVVRRTRTRATSTDLATTDADARRLLERMKQLHDSDHLAELAVGFACQGEDFLADPHEVEAIIAALIRENPPFLHIAREGAADDEGHANHVATEYLLRDDEVTVTEPLTLFVPQVGVEHLESRRPPGYPVIRPAQSLSDLRLAPLLYQELPEDLLVARLLDGSIPLMAYREERRYLLFRQEQRLVTRRERRRNHVPIEIETGGEGSSARLMYLLFDRSTSLVHNCAPRGVNAVMELAIALAMIRCDMGRPHARYYFRAFADRLDPIAKDAPVCAATVAEKDALARRLVATSFSGEATRIVDALEAAADDIERIVESGALGPNVKPRIGLLTDGRSSLYGSIGARLKRLGIELDTVLIGRDAAHNPELLRASSTVSFVDPAQYRAAMAA